MITTRLARPDDGPALLSGIRQLAAFHGDDSTVTQADLSRDFFAPSPWFFALIAENDGKTAGYAALLRLGQLQFGGRGMDLHHLFVWPDQRGLGIGRTLISAARTFALGQGCSYLMVGTHPDNTSAEAYYLHLGFKRRGNTPRFAISLAKGSD